MTPEQKIKLLELELKGIRKNYAALKQKNKKLIKLAKNSMKLLAESGVFFV